LKEAATFFLLSVVDWTHHVERFLQSLKLIQIK